jgi:hypothetical protein
MTYKDNLLDGPTRHFHENGNLKAEFFYAANIREGRFTAYYEDGVKQTEAVYKQGKLEGPYKVYYEEGMIREEAIFVNNVREGLGITYHLNGRVEIKADFKEGRMLSYENFDENGKPQQAETRENAYGYSQYCISKTIAIAMVFMKKATSTLRVFCFRPFRARSSHPLCRGWCLCRGKAHSLPLTHGDYPVILLAYAN